MGDAVNAVEASPRASDESEGSDETSDEAPETPETPETPEPLVDTNIEFAFRTHGTVPAEDARNFTCRLKARRCKATMRSGQRCMRMCDITAPYCRQHLLSERRLCVSTSRLDIPGGNTLGLFASTTAVPELGAGGTDGRRRRVLYRAGEIILRYEGETVTRQQLFERYGKFTAPYCMQVGREKFVDSACQRCACAMANAPMAPLTANAIFERHPHSTVYLVAKEPIRDGDEILAGYGSEYYFDEPTTASTRFPAGYYRPNQAHPAAKRKRARSRSRSRAAATN